jgi:DNA-binding phage protein
MDLDGKRVCSWIMKAGQTKSGMLLDIEHVRHILKRKIARAGGVAAFANQNSLERSNISHTLTGQRPPSKRLLKFLGLKRVTVYQKIRK